MSSVYVFSLLLRVFQLKGGGLSEAKGGTVGAPTLRKIPHKEMFQNDNKERIPLLYIPMKNLRETCIDFFKDENTKKDVREMMKSVFSMIYNEIYVYIWIIAMYNIFFIIMFLVMFIILFQILQKNTTKIHSV